MASSFARRVLTSSLLLIFIPVCTPTATTNSCDEFHGHDKQCTGANGNCAFFVKHYKKFKCKDWCEFQSSTCVSNQINKGDLYSPPEEDKCIGEGSVSTDCTKKNKNQICTCTPKSIRKFYIIRSLDVQFLCPHDVCR